MKSICLFVMLITVLSASAQPTINMKDFAPLEGIWKGSLTYLDYTDKTQRTIPANTKIEIVNDSTFDQAIYYSAEPDKNAYSRYTIHSGGTMLSEAKLIERTILADGSLQIILESTGPDGNDNRPATFHRVYIFSATKFTITKMVKFDGEKEFFQRHQYSFSK
jgi:hypothetical protein